MAGVTLRRAEFGAGTVLAKFEYLGQGLVTDLRVRLIRTRRAQGNAACINASRNGDYGRSYGGLAVTCVTTAGQHSQHSGGNPGYSDPRAEVASLYTRYHTTTTVMAVDRLTLLVQAKPIPRSTIDQMLMRSRDEAIPRTNLAVVSGSR